MTKTASQPVSDKDALSMRWPLILATLLLTAAFAWVFHMSIDRAVSARSAELSLETGNAEAVKGESLTLTPTLGSLPEAPPQRQKPAQPAPWWPALLFGLAFVCGWGFRHTLRNRANVNVRSDSTHGVHLKPVVSDATPIKVVAEEKTEDEVDVTQEVARALKVKNIRLATGPDLTKDFPWDKSALGDLSGLSSEQHIARLEKQNASKAEIIKALERLVTENREKWLHQDETEARLNLHIQELSEDLQLAVRQLQELQSDTSASGLHRRKSAG